ncbi:hypothetical protein HPB51_021359 [Rhipicephalus microplus]|uniref:Uncharacterized protein n=1 Tax=Rhipicephalus microplus TaxID=6941 RepID=A0A9J6F7W2_RHIMP|nr:hypothetical protein HPB51_021359 [Rhipicephalus microplus]
MAELTEEQASLLKKGDSGSSADKVGHEEVDDLAERMCLSLSPSNWEDVSCIVDLAKFAAPEIGGGDDGEDALRLAADKTDIKSTHPSRITIMPLGSVEGTDYSFARAVGTPWTLLATKLRSWTSPTAEEAAKKVGKVEVYAATESGREACCLLVDEETCELDVVFTGYYQPYTTPGPMIDDQLILPARPPAAKRCPVCKAFGSERMQRLTVGAPPSRLKTREERNNVRLYSSRTSASWTSRAEMAVACALGLYTAPHRSRQLGLVRRHDQPGALFRGVQGRARTMGRRRFGRARSQAWNRVRRRHALRTDRLDGRPALQAQEREVVHPFAN